MRACLLALACLLLSACGETVSIEAEDLRIEVDVAEGSHAVGRGIPIRVRRTWNKALDPAPWDDAQLAPLDLVLQDTQRIEDDLRVQETRTYLGYAFQHKAIDIEAPVFAARTLAGGALRVAQADPIHLDIEPGVDLKNPGPPEAPGLLPPPPASKLPLAVGGLAVLLLGVLVLQLRLDRARLRAQVSPEAANAARIAERTRALGALASRLETLRDADGSVGAAADVVRQAVHLTHQIDAPRRTTEETLQAVPDVSVLTEILTLADRTKFGTHAPDPAARLLAYERALGYVQAGRAS